MALDQTRDRRMNEIEAGAADLSEPSGNYSRRGRGPPVSSSGTLGRRYIGIDISPEYCDIARARLQAVEESVPVKERKSGQLPLFGAAQ